MPLYTYLIEGNRLRGVPWVIPQVIEDHDLYEQVMGGLDGRVARGRCLGVLPPLIHARPFSDVDVWTIRLARNP